jgi:integrase
VLHEKIRGCYLEKILIKITDSVLRNIPPSITLINDTEIKGFHVRLGKVKADGTRSGAYYLYYRIGGRKGFQRNYKIDNISTVGMTASKVRDQAIIFTGLVKSGVDIFAEREKQERTNILEREAIAQVQEVQKKIESETVAFLMAEFTERYINLERKRPESARYIIDTNINPAIGHIPLAEVTSRIVLTQCIDPIKNIGHKAHARKVLALLKQGFRFGVDRGLIESNPIGQMSVSTNVGKEISRDRFLTLSEIKVLLTNLPRVGMSRQVQLAIELLLLTGCRVQELTLSEWAHVDFDEKMWHFPPENTKSRIGEEKAHDVPLNDEIIKRLTELKLLFAYIDSKFILPSITTQQGEPGSQPLDKRSIARAVARNYEALKVEKFTPHDFRRTLQSNLIPLGVDTIVTEKLLNHELQGMLRIYNQYDYMDERRAALALWANKIKEITK